MTDVQPGVEEESEPAAAAPDPPMATPEAAESTDVGNLRAS